jgi:hypothetical protein
LDDNGGPTLTHALLSGSPAIDAGNNAYATDWDQRGPGFPRIVNGIIDIGAFEYQGDGSGPSASHSIQGTALGPAAMPFLGTDLAALRPSVVPVLAPWSLGVSEPVVSRGEVSWEVHVSALDRSLASGQVATETRSPRSDHPEPASGFDPLADYRSSEVCGFLDSFVGDSPVSC